MTEDNTKPNAFKWFTIYLAPPMAIVFVSVVLLIIASALFKPTPDTKENKAIIPTVEVVQAASSEVQIEVASQGTVQARTQTNLVAEVSGRIESVSPAFYSGGFFEKGDTLITIDPIDYEANLAIARSRQAEARLVYEQEQALADQAKEDWATISSSEPPSSLVLREPQLERAKANLEAATASVAIAKRDLDRTVVKAPYDGRVREKFVDIGQIVNARASRLASIYSIDIAEIRLPISLEDAQYLRIDEGLIRNIAPSEKPIAILEAKYAGKTHSWTARIDRTEGAVDPQTRMMYLVAQVEDPYQQNSKRSGTPLTVGMFVTARLQGVVLENAFELPRQALRQGRLLYAVDDEKRLEILQPEIYKKNEDTIIVTGGIEDGMSICLTPLQYAVNGMQLELARQEPETEIVEKADETPSDT